MPKLTPDSYRVKTLDARSFALECRQLELSVEDSGFVPDCILGIESGGRYVAENIFKNVPHFYTSLRRPSTSKKRGLMGKVISTILHFVPFWIKDWLRVIEARRLSAGFHRRLEDADLLKAEIDMRMELADIPDLTGRRSVLIVDDAIDSGLTMSAVIGALRQTYPLLDKRVAVITITDPHALVIPDYTIYKNHTLIRFPWSIDS